MRERWYDYMCGSPWREWLWVLFGYRGWRRIPHRFNRWRKGWRKCHKCNCTINIGTQDWLGFECITVKEGCAEELVTYCPSCTEEFDLGSPVITATHKRGK